MKSLFTGIVCAAMTEHFLNLRTCYDSQDTLAGRQEIGNQLCDVRRSVFLLTGGIVVDDYARNIRSPDKLRKEIALTRARMEKYLERTTTRAQATTKQARLGQLGKRLDALMEELKLSESMQ
jgi:hypothetical protein